MLQLQIFSCDHTSIFTPKILPFLTFSWTSTLSTHTKNYHNITGVVHVCIFCECSCEDNCSSEHINNICAITCAFKCVRLLARVSTYPFVRVCVIWCVWCVVVKHICLQAIAFAYTACPLGVRLTDAYCVPLAAHGVPLLWRGARVGVDVLADRYHQHTYIENDGYRCVFSS